MRHVMIILTFIVTTQPALLVAWGSGCGSLDCPQSAQQVETCGGCSHCEVADGTQVCCCASKKSKGDEIPLSTPPGGQKELAEFLLVLTPIPSAGIDVAEPPTPTTPDAFDFTPAADAERSHNERLALHCILRT